MTDIPFRDVMVPLSAVLGLSLVVERLLELGKNFLEPVIGLKNTRAIPAVPAGKLSDAPGHSNDAAWEERVAHSTVLVEPATDADDGSTLRVLIIQLLGFAAGILLTRFTNVQLMSVFIPMLKQHLWADYVLTGLLIGGGSGPVHVLIRFISDRKMTIEEQESVRSAPLPAASALSGAPAVLTPANGSKDSSPDIVYDGGVDREKLESIHKREHDPDMIVYHHTTMNSKSTFEDVVRVIKSRTDGKGNHWLTGYHCVITADGSIHPFCRWDRYGSHAAGFNKNSLGIAFNGNFEPDRAVPFSNPDGRYGPLRPTEAQLRAGARVVALWTHVYGKSLGIKESKMTPLFKGVIRPHSEVPNSHKTCPGSGFPRAEFERWVEYYYKEWLAPAYGNQLEAFKLKPYLYI